MAITLVTAITGSADNPVILSASPGAAVFAIDSEQFEVVGDLPPATQFVPGSGTYTGNEATAFSGAAGLRVAVSPVSVTVRRGVNGTQPTAHTAGTAVTPLFPVYSATAGKTV